MLGDFLILGSFMGLWLGVSGFSFRYFECPEHLDPKKNEGKKTKEYFDFYGNYVSIFHAIFSTILCSLVLAVEGFSFGAPNTFLLKLGVSNTLAYFIYDIIISEYYGYNSLAMTLHHIGSIMGVGVIFILGKCGHEAMISIILAEISNPFNLYRDILKQFKMENTRLYLNVSLTFAGLFIFGRFILFPFYLAKLYVSNSHILVKCISGFVWFISWHWLFIIFNLAFKELKVFNDTEKTKEDIKTNNIWNKPYSVFAKLRKSRTFLGSFYLGAAYLSFGTLYAEHTALQAV